MEFDSCPVRGKGLGEHARPSARHRALADVTLAERSCPIFREIPSFARPALPGAKVIWITLIRGETPFHRLPDGQMR
jgi:hypothetical protein